jgi:hypothetical protein
VFFPEPHIRIESGVNPVTYLVGTWAHSSFMKLRTRGATPSRPLYAFLASYMVTSLIICSLNDQFTQILT